MKIERSALRLKTEKKKKEITKKKKKLTPTPTPTPRFTDTPNLLSLTPSVKFIVTNPKCQIYRH